MSDMPILSQSAQELLVKVRMIVPPMLEKFHKGTKHSSEVLLTHKLIYIILGQLGRVAVVGGSEKCVAYITGASSSLTPRLK